MCIIGVTIGEGMSTVKRWDVELATPGVKGSFKVRITASDEATALSEALRRFPDCYVVITHEVK
jgi:hypothetical protein